MIENQARVVRVDGQSAWVRAESPSSCGVCAGKGCGSSVYVRLLHPGEPEYTVLNPISAEAGDLVIVGIEDGALLRTAIQAYVVPLLLLLSGAVMGSYWGEAQSIAGGTLGLLLAVVWLKQIRKAPFPVILKKGMKACLPE